MVVDCLAKLVLSAKLLLMRALIGRVVLWLTFEVLRCYGTVSELFMMSSLDYFAELVVAE